MKVILSGSVYATYEEAIQTYARCPWIGFTTTIVTGHSRGAEHWASLWATANRLEQLRCSDNYWTDGLMGRAKRNRYMASIAHGLIATWRGREHAVFDLIQQARYRGLRGFVWCPAHGLGRQMSAKGDLLTLWEELEERAAIIASDNSFLQRGEAEWRACEIVCRKLDSYSVPVTLKWKKPEPRDIRDSPWRDRK